MRKWEAGERRFDRYGEFRLMAAAEGFVMYRRKGCCTGVKTIQEWDALARFACQVGGNAALRVVR
jgi:hypothetical protein